MKRNPASEKREMTAMSQGQEVHHQLWPGLLSFEPKEAIETEVGVTVLKFHW
jgi:hypothetical protein